MNGEAKRTAALPTPRWVADNEAFAEVVAALLSEPAYAVDTEFHRERTYYPKVGLLQLAWPGDVALVDPLAVDLAPLAEVLTGPGVAVMHAADQDLEVLDRACGTAPSHLFDTQIAAGFCGYSTPSLSSLVEAELGIRLPKGDRLTDWLHRPLRPEVITYAATDVAYLLELYEMLSGRLDERGRLAWALEECDLMLRRPRGPNDPDSAWLRIKEAKHLRGEGRSIARALAAWRERTAAETDQPVRFVLPDLALVGIAQHPPKGADDIRRIRGVDDRHLRGGAAKEIIEVVHRGRSEAPPTSNGGRNIELDRRLRPAVALVSAWVGQLARDEDIDSALLATRADQEALLRGDADARLTVGWRAELVGEPIRRLVEGRAALAFDGAGGLVLEDRVPVTSRDPKLA